MYYGFRESDSLTQKLRSIALVPFALDKRAGGRRIKYRNLPLLKLLPSPNRRLFLVRYETDEEHSLSDTNLLHDARKSITH